MTQFLDPYDVSQEAVIQLSVTLHSLYAMVSDLSPKEFPASICPCLDCLWHQFRDNFEAGTVQRIGRSHIFPTEEYVTTDALPDDVEPEIGPNMPSWLDLDIPGLDDIGKEG